MQTSDLNSPVIPQRLLAQHQQCSPGIDQLIQKAEFENSEQVRLIETEKQRYAALLRQLDEKTRQTEELEKSTTQLDEEAKQLHKQFTQNREICESLKRTNSVLQEHEEALQKKKETMLAKLQQVRLENQSVLAKYGAIWDRYKTRYESKGNAKELTKIKMDAMKNKEELETIRSKVQQLETGISSMEEEKKNIEESADKGITSSIPVIIKLAHLNLETRKTEDCLQQITTKIKDSKEEQARKSTARESQSNKSADDERLHSEQLPVSTNQQNRCFTEDQTSVTHNEYNIQPHLPSSTDALEKGNCSAPKSPSVASHHNEEETIFPTTPTSAGQHSTGFTPSSEVVNSPFNFEMHSNMIQQLTKSPGDGFLFQSRPMFDSSSMDKENDQANKENAPFLFNMQEARNIPGPTGTGGEFHLTGETTNIFGPPVSGERSEGAGFFGTSMSPAVNGCSIFGDAGPSQQTRGSDNFSFSFGATSPNTDQNRSAAFSLF
ncbi:uncharacterized protein LOC144656809 [Oculina patagonica]